MKSYATRSAGYNATLKTMQQGFDRPILTALRSPKSSTQSLATALAESNWTGFGARSWAEQLYAAEIARVPMRSFHLPLPTVSLQGRLVDPTGRALGDVCVSALSPSAPAKGVVTSSNGSFRLANLPRATYRLQILDCRHVAGNDVPVYFSKSSPHLVTLASAKATRFSARCAGISACPTQHLTIRTPIEYGILTPAVAWTAPSPITYGTVLSRTQLDARTTVPGSYSYTPAEGTVLEPGSHTIRVTFHPNDRLAWRSQTSTVQLEVRRAVPPVVWAPPAEIPAGTVLSASVLDATSSIAGEFAYVPAAGAVLAPGVHRLEVRFQPRDAKRMRAVVKAVDVVVTAASAAAPENAETTSVTG